jgi:Mn2+/Fe2+ NRAMP family transporter
MNHQSVRHLGHLLGPGILFAASSVGTSHLVQSTRAGANYGLALWGLIIFACLIKYPAFRFGSEYAAATGSTLIDSYFRQGRWAVFIYGVDVIVTMFIATSAVALVTGGLINHVFQRAISDIAVASQLLAASAAVLVSGKYHLFEQITKVFVLLFTVTILVAVSVTLPDLAVEPADLAPFVELDKKTILFMIALAGWMPTGMSQSVFQSLWVCAKSKAIGRPLTPQEARFDFNLGYVSTFILALCFLILGTVLMFQQGISVSETSSGFAAQLMALFTGSIGAWAYPVIASAAIAIMLSTVLTLLDACPRALSTLVSSKNHSVDATEAEEKYYGILILTQCVGASGILFFFMSRFTTFIDFATSVAFLTAPFLAFLNHRAVFSSEVAEQFRPSNIIRAWSVMGIAIMGGFALYYAYYGLFC